MTFVSATNPFADNWYFGSVRSGAEGRVRDAGHGLRVHVVPWAPGSTDAAVAAMLDDLSDADCIGAIGMGCSPTRAQADRLLEHGKPVVLTSVRSEVLPTVGIDDEEAASIATRHLIELGHRSIVHLTGFTARAVAADDVSMRIDRARGYSREMAAAGLEDFAQVTPCEFEDLAKVRIASLRLLTDGDRPSAVFAVTDEVAFVVLQAAREAGLRVPEDVAVIGIDDHPDSAARDLSTVRQSPAEVGAAAADRVLGSAGEDRRTVTLALIARDTTGSTTADAAPTRRRPRFFGALRRPSV